MENTTSEMHLIGELPILGFKMSDFNIEPPTAMFETFRTGDEVTIKYDILLHK